VGFQVVQLVWLGHAARMDFIAGSASYPRKPFIP
jgi:hypothetical protein